MLAAVLLSASGCGGDNAPSDTSSQERETAKGGFVQKADAVCRDAQRKSNAIRDEIGIERGGGQSAGDVVRFAQRLDPLFADSLRRLSALEPEAPQPLRLRFGRYVTSLERQRELTADFARAFSGGQGSRVRVLAEQVERQASGTKRLAIGAGLAECGIGRG